MRRHLFSPREIKFLEKNVPGRGFPEAAKLFNKHFGLRVPHSKIRAAAKNRGITSGRDCRFRPGHISYNKGKKGYCPPGSEKGWFKPGNRPQTYLPVGTEIIDSYGYVKVKIADPNKWNFKHRIIWEKAYGKVPRGHIVIFADGNKLNVRLNNLLLVSRSEHAVMNKWGLRSSDREMTKTGKAIADIKMLIAGRKRDNCHKRRKSKRMEEVHGKH
ncbi:MAG: HNH endonuclease [Treponema sp.]|jgi:hypothetical protein|nr:HNH endonuclease [Treponema sp.]